MSALFNKFGVTVGCIAGKTSFINQDGREVTVGTCCWYIGNFKNRAGVIDSFTYSDSYTSARLPDVDDEDATIPEEEEENDDFGLSELFTL